MVEGPTGLLEPFSKKSIALAGTNYGQVSDPSWTPLEIEEAIFSGCDKGYTTISYSAIALGYEPQGTPQFGEEFLQALKEKGCILVQGSGNLGYSQWQDDPKDAIIRVGALNLVGEYSDFTSNGEIYALGKIVTDQIEFEASNKFQKNGTSFSTPQVASIISIVRSILEEKAEFRSLSGLEKVELLNELILGQLNPEFSSINAPKSVLLALQWPEKPSSENQEAAANALGLTYDSISSISQKASFAEYLSNDKNKKIESSKAAATYYKNLGLADQTAYFLKKYMAYSGISDILDPSLQDFASQISENFSTDIVNYESRIFLLALNPHAEHAKKYWQESRIEQNTDLISGFVRPLDLHEVSNEKMILDLFISFNKNLGGEFALSMIDEYFEHCFDKISEYQLNMKNPSGGYDGGRALPKVPNHLFAYLLLLDRLIQDERAANIKTDLTSRMTSIKEKLDKSVVPLKTFSRRGQRDLNRFDIETGISPEITGSHIDDFDAEKFSFLFDSRLDENYFDSDEKILNTSGFVIGIALKKEFDAKRDPVLAKRVLDLASNNRLWEEVRTDDQGSSITSLALYSLVSYMIDNDIKDIDTIYDMRNKYHRSRSISFLSEYLTFLNPNNNHFSTWFNEEILSPSAIMFDRSSWYYAALRSYLLKLDSYPVEVFKSNLINLSHESGGVREIFDDLNIDYSNQELVNYINDSDKLGMLISLSVPTNAYENRLNLSTYVEKETIYKSLENHLGNFLFDILENLEFTSSGFESVLYSIYNLNLCPGVESKEKIGIKLEALNGEAGSITQESPSNSKDREILVNAANYSRIFENILDVCY
ncbi:MAG: S8 family serine peptidase [Pseudobacteriovorax sp.]|nr:S8 family serine peptidase [Pseudobacteriovorax sp.]